MSAPAQPSFGELRAVFRLLGDIRDLRHDPIAWQRHAVDGICRLIGARQGSAIGMEGFRPDGQLKLTSAVHGGWANPAAAAIWEAMLRTGNLRGDVLIDRATHVPGQVVSLLREELVPDDVFYASPLVQEIMPITEIDSHVVGWHHAGGRDAVRGWTFHRDRQDPRFAERERAILRLFLEELHHLWAQGKLDPHPATDHPHLSPREQNVLALILKGGTAKEMAAALALSKHTVNEHVKSIYTKYGVNSRAELMARFLQPQPAKPN